MGNNPSTAEDASKPFSVVSQIANQIFAKFPEQQDIQIPGIIHYATMHNGELGISVELVGELHLKQHLANDGKGFLSFFEAARLDCPGTDFFVEMNSIFKNAKSEENDQTDSSQLIQKLRQTRCNIHAVDARSEMPEVIAAPVQLFDQLIHLGVSPDAEERIHGYLNGTLYHFAMLIGQLRDENDPEKWHIKILSRMVAGLPTQELKRKFIKLVQDRFSLLFDMALNEQSNVMFSLRTLQATFMDLYTIARILKKQPTKAVVYGGGAHTSQIEQLLVEIGFKNAQDPSPFHHEITDSVLTIKRHKKQP